MQGTEEAEALDEEDWHRGFFIKKVGAACNSHFLCATSTDPTHSHASRDMLERLHKTLVLNTGGDQWHRSATAHPHPHAC